MDVGTFSRASWPDSSRRTAWVGWVRMDLLGTSQGRRAREALGGCSALGATLASSLSSPRSRLNGHAGDSATLGQLRGSRPSPLSSGRHLASASTVLSKRRPSHGWLRRTFAGLGCRSAQEPPFIFSPHDTGSVCSG